MSHVSCHLTCAIQLLIHGMQPLCEALVEIGRSKTQRNSFLALLGNLIDEYNNNQSHDNNNYNNHVNDDIDDVSEDPPPMDPSRFYKAIKENTSIDPNDIGDAVTAIRRILLAIRAASATTSSASTTTAATLDELFKLQLRGFVRQDIVGRKGSLQRIKSKDREMACPLPISGRLGSVELGLAHATTSRQCIKEFDWDQVNNYIESDLLTDGEHDKDDHDDSWETYKVNHFMSLPQCLLLHLERFSYGGDGILCPTIETLNVPLRIDMRNYLSDSDSGSSCQYNLHGAILHVLDREGQDDNEEGGHYVSAHLVGDDSWYLVDDEVVSRIPSVDIIAFLSGRPCLNAGTKCTYIVVLLLYCCEDADSSPYMLENLRTELAALGKSEEHSVIGRRLKVKWAKGKWYAGAVSGYDEATGKHSVLYDDGDVRHYNLEKKVIKWE